MRFPFTAQRRRRPASSSVEAREAEALALIDHLWGTALRLTGRRGDAADLVYRTYVEAFRPAAGVPAGTAMKTRLFTLLHDAAGQTRATIRPDSTEEDAWPADLAASVSDSAGSGDPPDCSTASEEEVKAALDSLPGFLRHIVFLRDVEGFSCAEIARMLRLTETGVRQQVGRGRRVLYARLTRCPHPPTIALTAGAPL